MLKQLKILLDNEIDPAFSARAKLIFSQIEKESPQKILDVGCGRGFYVEALTLFKSIKEICGIDNNEEYINKAKKRIKSRKVKLVLGTVYKLPYPDNYFDVVICSELLEHLKKENKALVEIKRVIKKNGILLVTVPSINFPFFWDPPNWILMRFLHTHINKNIWFAAGIWADHERLYSKKEVSEKIEKAGFVIKKVYSKVTFCWPFSHFLLYGVGKNIIEILGIKEFSRFELRKNILKSFLSRIVALPTKLNFSNTPVNYIIVSKNN